MYMTPSTTARTSAVRLLPPRFAGGISGPMSAHSSSVRSLGYRSLPRSYRARFSRVHMAAVLPAPAVSGQSQPIQMTQLVPGQTLSSTLHVPFGARYGNALPPFRGGYDVFPAAAGIRILRVDRQPPWKARSRTLAQVNQRLTAPSAERHVQSRAQDDAAGRVRRHGVKCNVKPELRHAILPFAR